MQKKSILLIALLITALFSCKKPTNKVSYQDLLRNGVWLQIQGSSIHYTAGAPNLPYDYLAAVPGCKRDNTLRFLTNNNGVQNMNGATCIPVEPGQIPFNWEIYNDQSAIRIYNADATLISSAIDASILRLDADTMKLTYRNILTDTITFKRDTFYLTDVYKCFY